MVLFVYDFFVSESKSQVYGMLQRVVFKLREIKEHRYCLIIVFPCILIAFHTNSSYLQLCARMMLFHEDILSS